MIGGSGLYQVVLVSSSRQVSEDFAKKDLWEHDFELSLVTEDVNEALLRKPQVLICPVKSSIADGLKIARQAFEENWNTKVILYGRRTYEYAQMAVNAHAWGYLSMPLDNVEIVNMEIGIKRFFEAVSRSADGQNSEDIPLIREYFIYNLCQGQIPDFSKAKTSFSNLIPVENAGEIVLLKLVISDFSDYLASQWKYGKDTLYTAVSNFVIKSYSENFTFNVSRDGKEMYFMTVFKENGYDEDDFEKKEHEIENQLLELMNMEVVIRKPMIFENLEDLYEQAKVQPLLPAGRKTEVIKAENEIISSLEQESTVIGNAKEYINSCYNQEIGLDDVAEFVDLSPAYFSRLFKQETGENFIDYLIKVRMEHGKHLLETTTHKTYEISQMVGYKKSKYFSKLFKKYSGFTATEYRSYMNKAKQKIQLNKM